MRPVPAADPGPSIALVAVLVPDEPRFHGPAFNRAGQMFTDELARAVSRAGLAPDAIFSLEPLPAFPRSRRLFGRASLETTRTGLRLRLLPFVNVQPLKALTGGLAVAAALVVWACRHRRHPRLMWAVNLTMPPGVFVWMAARLTGSRVMVSVLDVWRPGGLVPDTWAHRLDFAVQRWLLPHLDGHMVVARAIADDLVPNRRVCLVEGGVAEDRVAPPPPRRPPSGRFRLALAGSLEPYNGFEVVAGAMALLPDTYELVIAGAGSLESAARNLAARDPRVSFCGFLSFEAVLDLYASVDLLLNVRLTQAVDTRYFFPSKLMESLVSGTPVLSTSTGAVDSEYGHVLYLLREETPEALAARIRTIAAIDPDERRALGARARAFMLRDKTWRRQGERLARYIREDVLA